MDLEYGDLLMCTVEKIEKTIVFVKIDGGGEGSIVMSEIAPGRIRNIRNYVVPKKKIVCKVLRISQKGNVELSLRRVTPKERKELIGKNKQEKNYMSLLKNVLGENSKKIIQDILKNESLYDFFEDIKENPKKLDKVFGKDSKKILEILVSQKQKKVKAKKEMVLKSSEPNGLELIKKLVEKTKAKVKYISAGKYILETESEDIKTANKIVLEIANDMEKRAKILKVEFSIKEK